MQKQYIYQNCVIAAYTTTIVGEVREGVEEDEGEGNDSDNDYDNCSLNKLVTIESIQASLTIHICQSFQQIR